MRAVSISEQIDRAADALLGGSPSGKCLITANMVQRELASLVGRTSDSDVFVAMEWNAGSLSYAMRARVHGYLYETYMDERELLLSLNDFSNSHLQPIADDVRPRISGSYWSHVII